MADEKKSGDGGSKKGQLNIPYGSSEIVKVPIESPREQRNIPYGSMVPPQQPASTQPTGTDSGGAQGGSGGGSMGLSGGDGGQTGGAGSQRTGDSSSDEG